MSVKAVARHSFDVKLDIISPVICSGLAPVAFGVDTAFLRDEQGVPIIPADHIKGLLRASQKLDGNFGAASNDGDYSANRGCLFCSDFQLNKGQKESAGNRSMTRIKIDEGTGAVETGMLQVLELIAPPGEVLTFEGRVTLYSTQDVKDVQLKVKEAFDSVPQVGAFRTIGFGEIKEVEVRPCQEPKANSLDLSRTSTGQLFLELSVDRPLMVASQRIEGNVFESSEVIPGGTIKGAVAQALRRSGVVANEVDEALSSMTFSHAFPLDDGRFEGLPIPKNIVKYQVDKFGDLFDIKHDFEGVPIFETDWKADSSENNDFTIVADKLAGATKIETSRLQRTRTAVDDALGIAESEKLFVYMNYPSLKNTGEPRKWGMSISWDLNTGVDQIAIDQVLNQFKQPLDGVGKTDAVIEFGILNSAPIRYLEDKPEAEHKNAITLLTPALMFSGQDVGDVKAAYEAYWQEVFGEDCTGFKLDFYAQQTLEGGYQSKRFRTDENKYEPWVLTVPGSSFQFTHDDESSMASIEKKLETMMLTGLPLPQCFRDRTWKNCPFVPENGFGKISYTPKIRTTGGR